MRWHPAGGGISIHALREEGDQPPTAWLVLALNFYPRPPRGGRPYCQAWQPEQGRFLSTPSARRATPQNHLCHQHCAISIHALREEGDPFGPHCLLRMH